MFLISWERTAKKGTHIDCTFWRDFWGAPDGPFGGHEMFSFFLGGGGGGSGLNVRSCFFCCRLRRLDGSHSGQTPVPQQSCEQTHATEAYETGTGMQDLGVAQILGPKAPMTTEKKTKTKNHTKAFGGRNAPEAAEKRPKEKFGTSQEHPGRLGRFMWKFTFKGQNVRGTDGIYDRTDGTCPWDRRDTHPGVSRQHSLCLLVFSFPQ